MTAIAEYNMSFNEGSFKKDKEYDFEYLKNKDGIGENRTAVEVVTEEGHPQRFYIAEFNLLFRII